VVVYEKNSFKAKEIRLYKEDMEAISDDWNEALRKSLAGIDEGWMKDLISISK
jgi:hypothetical protein